jgi:hypothetical protein
MRNINNIFKLFLVILVFICDCTAGARRSRDDFDSRTAAEHRFEPLDFYGDDEVITGQGRQTDKHTKTEQPDSLLDRPEMPTLLKDSTDVGEIDQPLVIFRVQVFASKSFDEAQDFATQIEPLFMEGVFVEYQMPYYKVRVGEFYDPGDGESFLEDVKQMGFKNAWLVRIIQ